MSTTGFFEVPHEQPPNGNSNSKDPLGQFRTGLSDLARERAIQSGATEPQQADIDALTEHARAMAREVYRDRYDPALHPHDAMRHAEYETRMKERDEEK